MERNPKTLGIERPTVKPVTFPPIGPKAIYKVVDGDDWTLVANRFNIEVKALIAFNFQTTNPDEVNWCLRKYVGCNLPTKDGFNWKFSTSANPGLIYIPTTDLVGTTPLDLFSLDPDSIVMNEPRGRNQLARFLDRLPKEDHTTHFLHFTIDFYEIAHMALDIAGLTELLGAAGLVWDVAAPFLSIAAILAGIGGADLEAMEDIARREWISGFAFGVVLGALRAKNSYLHSHYLICNNCGGPRLHNSLYDTRPFEKAHNTGLLAGLAYGRQLNTVERLKLLKYFAEQIDYEYSSLSGFWKWTYVRQTDFIASSAGIFERDFPLTGVD